MPRKTKKDKVIAKLRRELAEQRVGSEKEEGPKHTPPLLTSKPTSHLSSPSPLLTYPVSLIKKDLTRTVGLAILAISLELGIYYLSKLEILPF